MAVPWCGSCPAAGALASGGTRDGSGRGRVGGSAGWEGQPGSGCAHTSTSKAEGAAEANGEGGTAARSCMVGVLASSVAGVGWGPGAAGMSEGCSSFGACVHSSGTYTEDGRMQLVQLWNRYDSVVPRTLQDASHVLQPVRTRRNMPVWVAAACLLCALKHACIKQHGRVSWVLFETCFKCLGYCSSSSESSGPDSPMSAYTSSKPRAQ